MHKGKKADKQRLTSSKRLMAFFAALQKNTQEDGFLTESEAYIIKI